MSSPPSILHADLDAFYASVEQRDHRRFRGRPVIVGLGVVLAASYEARTAGVRGGMGQAQALRRCPGAIVVAPRFSAYVAATREVFEIFERAAPLVEALSIDEAFLDVRGLEHFAGTPLEIAARLRREVREQVRLPITVGIARTKFLAKVASGVAKPDGLLLVEPELERDFLHPLGVERLWGVGPVMSRKLHLAGIHTVGELAREPEERLAGLLGKGAGRHLHALAQGRDPRPVRRGVRRRSIGSQRALGRRPRPLQELRSITAAIVDRVCRRLRAAGRVCRTVVLRLRFQDYVRASRSQTLPSPTALTEVILACALRLLSAATPLIERRGVTLIGVALSNLGDEAAIQLELPLWRRRELDRAVDGVRERFGHAALTRAALIGQDPGLAVPLLSDALGPARPGGAGIRPP